MADNALHRLHQQNTASSSTFSSVCCLVENGKRCFRPAGSHGFSKRMQKTIRQKRLKVAISSDSDHSLICQLHRQQLISQGKSNEQSSTSVAKKRPATSNDASRDSDDEFTSTNKRRKLAPIRFDLLSAKTLSRYKKFFKLQTRPGVNKNQLADVIGEHFRTIPVAEEKEILTYFVYAVKTNRNKLDHQTIKQNGTNGGDE